MLNRQLVFDTVTSHLLRQGERSVRIYNRVDETCAYRGKNGLKCSIGVLIPDGKYNKSMEGNNAFTAEIASAIDKQYGSVDSTPDPVNDLNSDGTFLWWLQWSHDSNYNRGTFLEDTIKRLANTVERFNLDPFILINCVRALAQSGAI